MLLECSIEKLAGGVKGFQSLSALAFLIFTFSALVEGILCRKGYFSRHDLKSQPQQAILSSSGEGSSADPGVSDHEQESGKAMCNYGPKVQMAGFDQHVHSA